MRKIDPKIKSERARKRAKEYYKNNKIKAMESIRKWDKANPDKKRGYRKKWAKANPNKVKKYHDNWAEKNLNRLQKNHKKNALKTLYNLSIEEFEIMKLKQNNKCAICGKEMDKPSVDHDHETGKIRGLLCQQCNSAIGFLNDNPAMAMNAARYLELGGKDQ